MFLNTNNNNHQPTTRRLQMADKRQNFVTHKGTAQYPWLNKADTQFDSDGVFKTNLLVPQDQAKGLVDQLTQIAKDEFGAKASGARMPYKVDEETGMMSIISKSKFQPKFFDSKGQVVTNPPPLYVTGNNGISLRLTKVQIIEPVSQVGAGMDGFEAEEDGFVAEEDQDFGSTDEEPETGATSYNF